MDTFTLTLLGACGTGMSAAIAVLWARDGQWREDYNKMVKEMQDKIDATNEKAINAINASANQMNSATALLVSMQETLRRMDEKWQTVINDIVNGRR